MPDLFRFNSEMEEYFSALPANVQDMIQHGNYKIGSLDDLVVCAENIMSEYHF